MVQNPITSLPPLPGTEWDPDNPGQLRRITKPERGQFDIPKPVGGVGTFDPSKPSEVKNVLDITKSALKGKRTVEYTIPGTDKKGSFDPSNPAQVKSFLAITAAPDTPLPNTVTEELSTGKTIKFKLDTPAKVAAYEELLWDRAHREEDRKLKLDKGQRERLADSEASIFDLIDRMGETTKGIEGFPQPKHSEKTIAGLQRLLQGKFSDYQKLRGTETLATVGGKALPGMKLNPYIIGSKDQLGLLTKTDWFQTPDGEIRLNDLSENPVLPGQEPTAEVEDPGGAESKAAGIIPKKEPKGKAEPKKPVDPALRRVEKRKLTVKLGKLTSELRTATEDSKDRIRKEIARVKADIKALTKPHQHHAGMKM